MLCKNFISSQANRMKIKKERNRNNIGGFATATIYKNKPLVSSHGEAKLTKQKLSKESKNIYEKNNNTF